MKGLLFIALQLGLWLASASCVWAETIDGCVDSPENPTVVLGLLGSGVAAYPWLRRRAAALLRRNRQS
jgi:XrtJ-associated TM-motif-TM protein